MTRRIRALILPWLIVGAITGAAIGAAASNIVSGMHVVHEETAATATDEVPELVIIPELWVIEGNDADEQYPDAP